MGASLVIETHNLTKQYGSKTACNQINISVEAGQIYGFLGPNGAGKSTCIKMLTGLVFPTSGSAEVLGKPLGDVSARQKMGYLPELFRYQEWMTGRELLEFHSRLFHLPKSKERTDSVLKRVGLDGQEKFKVGSYSKGMQQRIGLACALLPNPELLFLDEPTSALDPIGRKDVRDIIVSLKNDGTTIFLNSHLLSEVEAISDSVTIIHKGVVARSASMKDLLMEKIVLTIRADGVTDEMGEMLQLQKQQDGSFVINVQNQEQVPEIVARLVASGARIYEITPHRETLENVFMRIIEGGEPSLQQS